ncbi:MAG: OmpA family protein [Muribaculaceae bacterium]|nr:OmpA family protein [Muribaculaceae bacterium]MBR6490277.1 OmpA family protein [Muribaculaceae bacterium]
MKKIILLAIAAMTLSAASAQVTVEGNKIYDNISVTLKGGIVSPYQHYPFWKSAKPVAGIELRKQVTPILGIGVEGEWSFNTSRWNKSYGDHPSVWGPYSKTIVDHQLVGGFGTVSLTNLLLGYMGIPRTLDVEAVAGAGWWHAYKTGAVAGPGEEEVDFADKNSWYTKAGVNLNWNVGESKALTISLKPAVVWYMGRGAYQQTNAFNANCAAVEIEAGLTYHFKNHTGAHYMTLCPMRYTQADLDALNAQVNDLRSQLSGALADADAERARAARLQRELDECNKREPKVVTQTNVIDNSIENLETNVYFEIGKSVVSTAQMPNVERVAIFLKNHPDATCIIKGYASKDGPEDLNIRLANNRAKAVYDLLTGKYKIKASRIQSEGNGISEMFSEPEWNRVSICTIQHKK